MKTKEPSPSLLGEIGAWALGLAALYLALLPMLYHGSAVPRHDNLLWDLPIFQFWADNVGHGRFPYWNPFSHGGEPFYMIPLQIRLLEPLTYVILLAGKHLTSNLILLFNWNRIIQSLVMLFGVYLVLRRFSKRLLVRISLVPVLLFSSCMLGSFQQDAVFEHFLWAPYIAYLLLRILIDQDRAWHLWLLLGAAIGLNWTSYFFAGVWTFLLFFVGALACFRMDLLAALRDDRHCLAKLSALGAIVLAMMAPNAALLRERGEYVYPARMLDAASKNARALGGPQQYEGAPSTAAEPLDTDYAFVEHTGTFASGWEFLQMISPGGPLGMGWPVWGRPSEAFIYLGLWPWALGIFGMFFAQEELKKVWAANLVGFALLMMGPAGALHRVLFRLYPPLWFLRHTHALVLFFEFSFLYFYVIGFDHAVELYSTHHGTTAIPGK